MAVKLLIVVTVAVLLQVMGAFSGPVPNEERNAWSLDTWQEPMEHELSMRLAEIIKRSKAQQFHGLMGRSSETSHAVRLRRKRDYENAQRSEGEWYMYY